MNIIHLDVDNYSKPLLKERSYPHTIQEVKRPLLKAEIVTLTHNSQVNVDNLKKLPNVRLVITRTVGTDHIDLEMCKKRNIAVYHIIDYGATNIAEHVFALLLSGTRRVLDSQKEIRMGKFSYENFPGFTLKGKVLGVIGTGKIGLETIKIAKSFGMQIIAFDVYKNEQTAQELGFKYVDKSKLFTQSDVITLHAPLLPSTKHIINEESIGKMKEGIVLINTARGGLVHTEDLIKHIQKFRFVGLDVLEDEEKFSKIHPLLRFDNVIITPHIAFFTDYTIKKIAEETYKCIENFKMGIDTGRVI